MNRHTLAMIAPLGLLYSGLFPGGEGLSAASVEAPVSGLVALSHISLPQTPRPVSSPAARPGGLVAGRVSGGSARLAPAVKAAASVPGRLPGAVLSPATLSVAQPVAHQVSIEQHFSIRITPGAPAMPPELLDQLQHDGLPPSFEPRHIGRCVPIGAIGAVQGGEGNRLLLFMRDQHIIVAALEKACQAADFYSGFYVARNADGMLCTDRDRLQSRSGANCRVKALHALSPIPGLSSPPLPWRRFP